MYINIFVFDAYYSLFSELLCIFLVHKLCEQKSVFNPNEILKYPILAFKINISSSSSCYCEYSSSFRNPCQTCNICQRNLNKWWGYDSSKSDRVSLTTQMNVKFDREYLRMMIKRKQHVIYNRKEMSVKINLFLYYPVTHRKTIFNLVRWRTHPSFPPLLSGSLLPIFSRQIRISRQI